MSERKGVTGIRGRAEHGYSLIEIMFVVCLIGIVSAMAVPVSSDFLLQRKADSGNWQPGSEARPAAGTASISISEDFSWQRP